MEVVIKPYKDIPRFLKMDDKKENIWYIPVPVADLLPVSIFKTNFELLGLGDALIMNSVAICCSVRTTPAKQGGYS